MAMFLKKKIIFYITFNKKNCERSSLWTLLLIGRIFFFQQQENMGKIGLNNFRIDFENEPAHSIESAYSTVPAVL